ncbi:MAG TPA: lysophospholipid acyltransferase family protein [Sphingobium sp.]|nr:lysophospholipid acyltransferase family protein [Sphingobium sp.]
MAPPLPPLSPLGTAFTAVRSALFALLFYGLTLPFVLTALLVAPLGWRCIAAVATAWAWLHRLLARWILGQRIVIEGTLPEQPQLLICKHESMFETIDSLCLLRRPVIAAKRELIQIPLWGRVARTYGLISVERAGGAATLRHIRTDARAAFAAGRPVLLYPEGTRVVHGERPPLKAGFAGLYALLGCPVVPIAIDSGRLSPRNSFLKRAGTITYRIGPPIPPGLPRAEAERQVHAAINALNPPERPD